MDLRFNLVDEPWIRVRDEKCELLEVSLADALIHAHTYTALAGESPAQDAAILRLLIALVHTVFYRVDEDGRTAVLRDEDDALDRWEAIWEQKAFPEAPLRAYFAQWHDRFDLLDEEHPFYQVPEAAIGTSHTSAKLNGAILQSENKLRIFAGRTDKYSRSLAFPEAARWLVYLQGFDDASVKPKTVEGKKNVKSKPGSARGWLGNLGVIYTVGTNLFETIWLNNVLLRDGESLYAEPLPCWEREKARIGEYTQIPIPDNLAELFSLQSRRVLLKRETDRVIEYTEYCGDLVDQQNAFAEPMTAWRPIKKKTEITGYSPRQHNPSRQVWRDFSAIAVQTDRNRLPGITYWLAALQDEGRLEDKTMLRFSTVSVLYDSSGSSVTNTVNDTLSFHLDLLTMAGRNWQVRIEDQVQFCDKLADALGMLSGELSIAAGKREIENKKTLPPQRMSVAEAAKTQFYYRIDAAFRQWLLRPRAGQDMDEVNAILDDWRDTAIRIARAQGKELVDEAGQAAFLGRWIESDDGKRSFHISSAEAFNRFVGKINRYKRGE